MQPLICHHISAYSISACSPVVISTCSCTTAAAAATSKLRCAPSSCVLPPGWP
jgi:hypothetical protein